MYVNEQTLEVVSEAQIKALFPDTSFARPFEPPAGFAKLHPPVSVPAYNTRTQTVSEAAPQKVNGVWRRTYVVRELSEQEKSVLVPQRVTMRQARLALIDAGLDGQVAAALEAMQDPVAKKKATTEWEYAQEVHRNSPLVLMLAQALGLSSAQLDELFYAAHAIQS